MGEELDAIYIEHCFEEVGVCVSVYVKESREIR